MYYWLIDGGPESRLLRAVFARTGTLVAVRRGSPADGAGRDKPAPGSPTLHRAHARHPPGSAPSPAILVKQGWEIDAAIDRGGRVRQLIEPDGRGMEVGVEPVPGTTPSDR